MEFVNKLEVTLAEQYEKLPHLPAGGRKWLADYAWLIVLIGVILSVLGLLGVLSVFGVVLFGLSVSGAALSGAAGAAAGATIGAIVLVTMVLSLAVYIIETILFGMAINPLKEYKKRGWDLLFIVFIANAAFAIITGLLSFNIIALIGNLLWVAVGGYFLFEVRERFVVKRIAIKPVKGSAKAKA